jgi:multicomponent K+:H+ antiporter subunit D
MPIVLPLVAGALLVLLEKARSRWVAPVSLPATGALWSWRRADGPGRPAARCRPTCWATGARPLASALALDRLSALMLVLTALVAGGALLFALGGEGRRGCTSTRCSSFS